MSPVPPSEVSDQHRSVDTSAVEHPRGTLAIMIVFGTLFGLGWLAMYVWRFLERGAPHH
jgi:hypothetical protein